MVIGVILEKYQKKLSDEKRWGENTKSSFDQKQYFRSRIKFYKDKLNSAKKGGKISGRIFTELYKKVCK